MLEALRPAVVMVAGFTLLLGLVAPVLLTALAGALMPGRAGGSLIVQDGRVVGSALLGQDFTGGQWFHPRPSATSEPDPDNSGRTRDRPYNGAASAASNLGPSSAALLAAVTGRVASLGPAPVPADAVNASGSGLDPHISPANAARQVARVAAVRGLPEARVAALLAANIEGRELGFLGEPRVNVLRLNLALAALR